MRGSHRIVPVSGFLLLAAVACLARAAAGQHANNPGIEARAGIWRGTVGDAEVMVCLNSKPDPYNSSRYYYVRHLTGIPLAYADDSGTTLQETSPEAPYAKPTATWSLQVPGGGHMQGTWASPDGSRSLPIHLVRIAKLGGSRSDGDCDYPSAAASRAFNAPRVAAQKLTTEQLPDGLRRVGALDGDISLVELPASIPHAATFNHGMRGRFAQDIADYYSCAFHAEGTAGSWTKDHASIALLSPPWVVVRNDVSDYCGGAHPNDAFDYKVWNLTAGKEVDGWDFVRSAKHCDTASCAHTPPAKLRAIINKRFMRGIVGDCKDVLPDSDTYYSAYPGRHGMFFTVGFSSFSVHLCSRNVLLPWKTIEPFLTPQGKAMMRSIRQGNPPHGG